MNAILFERFRFLKFMDVPQSISNSNIAAVIPLTSFDDWRKLLARYVGMCYSFAELSEVAAPNSSSTLLSTAFAMRIATSARGVRFPFS